MIYKVTEAGAICLTQAAVVRKFEDGTGVDFPATLLEDGTSFLLREDGVSHVLLET
jgi:hypothetical protein